MQAPQPHAREAELQDETEEDGGTAWQAKAWLQNMPIADVMSSALLRPLQLFLVKNKNPTITELEFLRGIAGLGSREMLTGLFTAANLHEHLTDLVTDVLWRGLCDLEGSASADAASRELNSKFQVEEDCVTMQYGPGMRLSFELFINRRTSVAAANRKLGPAEAFLEEFPSSMFHFHLNAAPASSSSSSAPFSVAEALTARTRWHNAPMRSALHSLCLTASRRRGRAPRVPAAPASAVTT